MKSIAILSTLPLLAYALPPGTFSYKPESETAPGAWQGLDLGEDIINECGGGKQSGIDVPTHQCDTFDDYVFSGGSCSLDDIDFTINDHSIVATYNTETNGCALPRMQIPGQDRAFEAIQFHLHTGSDHAVDGRYFGSCMHLVHKEVGSNRLSVLGFFLEPIASDGISKFRDLLAEWEAIAATTIFSCASQGFQIWSSQTPLNQTGISQQGGGRYLEEKSEKKQEHRKLPRSFNPYELIPAGSSMYTYEGSLTTPPCTESVLWNVVDSPIEISVREFLRLTNLIVDYANPESCELASAAAPSGFTGRPVQRLNGRTVDRICPTGFDDPLAALECPEPVVAPTNPPVAAGTPPVDAKSGDDDSGGATTVIMTAFVAVGASVVALF